MNEEQIIKSITFNLRLHVVNVSSLIDKIFFVRFQSQDEENFDRNNLNFRLTENLIFDLIDKCHLSQSRMRSRKCEIVSMNRIANDETSFSEIDIQFSYDEEWTLNQTCVWMTTISIQWFERFVITIASQNCFVFDLLLRAFESAQWSSRNLRNQREY